MTDILGLFAKICSEVYSTTTIPDRIAWIFWLLFFELYIFASALEKHNNLAKPRELKIINYHYLLFVFGGLSAVLQHGSQFFKWPLIFPILTSPNSYWLFVTGIISMIYGLYKVGAGRCAFNGYWGPHIYTYKNKEHNILKTDGILRHVRHPIFCGQIFMAGGTFLLFNNWLIALFPLSIIFLNIWRAKREEKDLEERFPDEFINYRNKTYFFIKNAF